MHGPSSADLQEQKSGVASELWEVLCSCVPGSAEISGNSGTRGRSPVADEGESLQQRDGDDYELAKMFMAQVLEQEKPFGRRRIRLMLDLSRRQRVSIIVVILFPGLYANDLHCLSQGPYNGDSANLGPNELSKVVTTVFDIASRSVISVPRDSDRSPESSEPSPLPSPCTSLSSSNNVMHISKARSSYGARGLLVSAASS